MAMILVTHDLGVVAGRADDIAVMYAGKVVEKAPTSIAVLLDPAPLHRGPAQVDPEARAPSHTRLDVIPGRPPDLISPPEGCNFSPRCPYAQPKCFAEEPTLEAGAGGGHEFACWYPVGTPQGRQALEDNLEAGRPQTEVAVAAGGEATDAEGVG